MLPLVQKLNNAMAIGASLFKILIVLATSTLFFPSFNVKCVS